MVRASQKTFVRRCLIAAAFAFFCCVTIPVVAQTAEADPAHTPKCTPTDLETHFKFYRGPAHTLNLAVFGKNISGHACVFNREIFTPQLEFPPNAPPRDLARGEAFPICNDCFQGLTEGKRYDPHPLIQPAEAARETFQWKTAPSRGPVACLKLLSIFATSYLVAAPSLLKNICSNVSVVGVDVLPATAVPGTSATGDRLRIAAPTGPLYAGERFRLQVSGPMPSLSPQQLEKCPELFVWQRRPDGRTTLQETVPENFRGCPPSWWFSHPRGGWRSGFVVDLSGDMGENRLQVFARVAPFGSGQSSLASSKVLDLRLLDPLMISRKWSRTSGLGANITLDKGTYRVGDDIHLHAAVANFDAPAPIFSSFSFGPIKFDVLDPEGHSVPENERFGGFPLTMDGHSPPTMAKGTIIPLEVNLRAVGCLPNRPGTYTIVMSWTADTNFVDPKDSDYYEKSFEPFETVQARATTRIVAAERTQETPHKGRANQGARASGYSAAP